MKGFLKFIGIVFCVFITIWEIFELLAIPALFAVIGILNDFSWKYYAISIGGYFLVLILAEVIAHFVFKALDKKYTPLFERKLNKIFNKTGIDKPLQ